MAPGNLVDNRFKRQFLLKSVAVPGFALVWRTRTSHLELHLLLKKREVNGAVEENIAQKWTAKHFCISTGFFFPSAGPLHYPSFSCKLEYAKNENRMPTRRAESEPIAASFQNRRVIYVKYTWLEMDSMETSTCRPIWVEKMNGTGKEIESLVVRPVTSLRRWMMRGLKKNKKPLIWLFSKVFL